MMLNDFAVATENVAYECPTADGAWPVAIDYGFSGVKGFAPNKRFCFPNCAVKLDESQAVLDVASTDLVLKDDSGLWAVGERAHEIITPANAMNYEAEMYERNRYFSPFFRVLMRASLALAIGPNPIGRYEGQRVVVQTGLPPKYKAQDGDPLKEAIAGRHQFELRVGAGPFRKYDIEVRFDDVLVMEQPMGSLISAITGPDGVQNPADAAVLRSKTIVFDPGFKTLDFYDISAGRHAGSNTFEDLGMHEVFRRTSEALRARYGVDVPVSGMQNAIRKGYVKAFDRRTMSNRKIGFDHVLEEKSAEVCMEAIGKLVSIYDYLQHHDYLIVTGGAGAAWFPTISEYFSKMEALNIFSANRNDPSLPNVYSNARGYYMYLVGALRRNRR